MAKRYTKQEDLLIIAKIAEGYSLEGIARITGRSYGSLTNRICLKLAPGGYRGVVGLLRSGKTPEQVLEMSPKYAPKPPVQLDLGREMQRAADLQDTRLRTHLRMTEQVLAKLMLAIGDHDKMRALHKAVTGASC